MVRGNESLAQELADSATLQALEARQVLIEQGNADNDMFLILAGIVSIEVNGQKVAERIAGQHVGEMALIDPSAPRSATVVAAESTVVAKVSEPAFSRLANKHPALWRELAGELSARLRQRGKLIRESNPAPRLFVGCSTEALPVAQEIQTGLAHDDILSVLWTDNVFGPSSYPLESLAERLADSDFAALLLSPDDTLTSRGAEVNAPRDNVIFELGLFMGALGRDRTFLILPRGVEIKIPSDILGVTPIDYAPGSVKELPSRIAPVCTQLRRAISTKGVR